MAASDSPITPRVNVSPNAGQDPADGVVRQPPHQVAANQCRRSEGEEAQNVDQGIVAAHVLAPTMYTNMRQRHETHRHPEPASPLSSGVTSHPDPDCRGLQGLVDDGRPIIGEAIGIDLVPQSGGESLCDQFGVI